MKTPQLLILLLTIMVHAGSGFPSDRKPAQGREKHASWDDVNVVAHGLLQLGQGLKEHVDKTKAQMRDVNTKLKAFNNTVAELQRRQQEQGAALEARGEEAEERAEAAAQLAEEVRARVDEVRKESDDIHSRMGKLEEKVQEVLAEPALDTNDSDHSGVLLIQRLVAAQNRRIDQLVDKIRQQQDKLEKQSLHLQALQSKVAQRRVKSHRRRDDETALKGEPEQSAATPGLARDCHDLFVQGQRASGVYVIQPEASKPVNVLCEMTAEGGWTVIQKRQDGSQNFNQQWESYKKGFGSLHGEFWLGLDNIHSVTKQGGYVLQVELSDRAGAQQAARYRVQVDGEEEKFALHLEQEQEQEPPSGPRGGALSTGASGVPFSTADSDNDLAADVSCAQLLSGGWWFSSCGESNLNGRYPRRPSQLRRRQVRRQAMFWDRNYSLRTTVLKVAPAAVKQ
ncbi:angiopoietin-related protein 4-like [Betta splendens]|uniref:Angiopoietin-related protein 4-like n=1 Tax=Betta splendens TaxID=158456 RepID=A0A6P7MG35_BETSP|nr:angiopoietin-related protein 4-like [Betta splendens]